MSKNNKPLSPHLTIYKPQITSLMSISHRFSGTFQYMGNLIIFIYFCAILFGENYHNFANLFFNSLLGKFFLFLYIFSICYHLFNGIRHLIWDIGFGFEIKNVYYSGYITLISAIILNLIIWFYI